MVRSRRLMALSAIVGLLATACGGGASPSASTVAIASAPPSQAASPAGPPVSIKWYCCLGTGQDPSQVKVEKEAVAAFNASHPNIKLSIEVVNYDNARDTLSTEIAGGNAPDIVGPVGVGGAEAFHGQWLDLDPYIQKNNLDLSQFATGSVDFYKISGEGQPALPFAIYPSFIWYQKGMFEEANLNEPPHKYGEKYKMPDGSEVDWDYNTVRTIAQMLTVDAAGKDATQAGFDPKKIRQYGFEPQRDDGRGWGAFFGAGSLAGPDGKTVKVPDPWKAAFKWFYDGVFKDHFIMTHATYTGSYIGNDNPFCSGHVAMETNFLWSKYCLVGEAGKKAPAGDDWDIAAAPSYSGKTTAAFNADTFRILKNSKHPDEAFTALVYLLTDGSKPLLDVYGGMPARTADQTAFFDGLNKQFTQKPDWQVAIDSIQYADNPNFEAYVPAYNATFDQVTKFWSKLRATAGLDVDSEIAKLEKDLQAIWDKAP
jgi:multiple sugar transport system substrate-binding protein